MGLRDWFQKKDDGDEFDPLADLKLDKLKVGYLLDYDMKTWQVTAYHRYDFGEGVTADEWELTSGREKWYLERSEDDDVEWTLSKKIPLGMIEGNIKKHIMANDDPPEKIICKDKKYYLDESGSGKAFEDGEGPSKQFVYWDFIDEEDESFVTIEQWDEDEFEAASGHYAEEYQFTNILPGADES